MGCSNSLPHLAKNKFSEEWYVIDKLGEGCYSQVFAVKHQTSRLVAALKLPKGNTEPWEDLQEAEMWRKIGRHEHVVGLIGTYTMAGINVMVMEKCDYTLSACIHDMPVASEAIMAPLFYQMSSAIAHLHYLRIVHRDVKPDNYLCMGGDSQTTLKLCDFGLSKIMPESGQLFGTFGTPLFMSPEMVGYGSHNLATDVWSLGVIWYLMLYGQHPYTANSLCRKKVMRTISLGTPEPKYQGRGSTSYAAKKAVSALLHRPMSTRVSAAQVLELSFLNLSSNE